MVEFPTGRMRERVAMFSPPRSPLCDACATLFKEGQMVKDNDSPFWDSVPVRWHRDVRSLECSAENGCSLCSTILRGFPQQELAWARRYLDLGSDEGTVVEYRGDYRFELFQEGQGYELHFYYRYLPPTCKAGDYDIFHLRVCLIPYEGMPRNTRQLRPV